MGPKPNVECLYKRGRQEAGRDQREATEGKTGGRNRREASASQGLLAALEAGRSKEGPSPGASEQGEALGPLEFDLCPSEL